MLFLDRRVSLLYWGLERRSLVYIKKERVHYKFIKFHFIFFRFKMILFNI